MARKISGNAYPSGGKWYARVSLVVEIEWGKKRKRTKRPNVLLAHIHDEETANARALLIAKCASSLIEAQQIECVGNTIKRLAELAPSEVASLNKAIDSVDAVVSRKVKLEPTSIGGQTFREVREALTDGKIHARFRDEIGALGADHCRDMVRVCTNYIEPIIGNLPPSAITVDHYRDVLRQLPDGFSPARRRFIAWSMKRVLEMAVLLRLIPANPISSKLMPKLGARRARGFLFPDEDAALMKGAHQPVEGAALTTERVPLVRRLIYGVLDREGMRKEEAAGLQWSDTRTANAVGWVDVERGWVSLDEHKTADKSGARDWPLDPGVGEALKRWKKFQPKGARFVFALDGKEGPNVEHLADLLRTDLMAVGVKRPELHTTTKTRRQINVHDLRGTFITLALAQGRTEGFIMRRSGHTTSEMVNLYRRQAENLAEGSEAKLLPLFEAIPELASQEELAPPPSGAPADSPGDGQLAEAPSSEAQTPSPIGGQLAEEPNIPSACFDADTVTPVDTEAMQPEIRIQVLAPSPAWGFKSPPSHKLETVEESGEADSAVREHRRNLPPIAPPIKMGEVPILRERLAELVKDAVVAGDLGLARRLVEALAAMPEAEVVDLRVERAKRR